MDDIWNFKSINLGRELETAGEFIYESAKKMIGINDFSNKYEINLILYTGSVGIERLQKILLCLYCINSADDFDNPPKCLLTHNHLDLQNEIQKNVDCSLAKTSMSLLGVFQDYYNQYRYGNYSLGNEKDVRELMVRFFKKCNKPLDIESPYTEHQKDLLAKTYINNVGKIAKQYYEIIREKAFQLNIYTYEMDSYSNALRVFYLEEGKTLFDQMFNERISVKELMIYIRKYNKSEGVFKLLNEIEPLDYDPALVMDYIHDLCRGNVTDFLYSYTDELYCEIPTERKKAERKALVDLIGSNDLILDDDFAD